MTDYFKEINNWADERGLLDIGYEHDKQCSFIAEEISELLRAKDEYEIADSFADVIVFSANAAKILGKTIIIDDQLIKNQSVLSNRRTADKITSASELLESLSGLLLEEDTHYDYYIDLILQSINGLIDYGYDVAITLEETLKEINSRTGAFNPESGKWEKFQTPEAIALHYKADYSLAKINLFAWGTAGSGFGEGSWK